MKVPLLQFSNPVFHPGFNLTVRKGRKWADARFVAWLSGDFAYSSAVTTQVKTLDDVTDADLIMEHDPACRTKAGLVAELERVYPGIVGTDEVTLVTFLVPGDYVKPV